MSIGQVIYYDFDHCREFLEERGRQLKDTASGLDTLAIHRELYYSFAYETLEKNALTSGQFDYGLCFLFTPLPLNALSYPQGHEVARAKIFELINTDKIPPIVMDLAGCEKMQPPLNDRHNFRVWMRPEFVSDMIDNGNVQIQMFFNAEAFYREVIIPQLKERGFHGMTPYVQAATAGLIKARHPSIPGKTLSVPWLNWIREMMSGGYSVVYLMACFASFIRQVDSTFLIPKP